MSKRVKDFYALEEAESDVVRFLMDNTPGGCVYNDCVYDSNGDFAFDVEPEVVTSLVNDGWLVYDFSSGAHLLTTDR